ncbi:hypothetical protein TrRE_jg10425 [Triparma retinervis]|uniref:Endonuclease/exonuclease/phosphatase domain-containing protein n=1 Tax=Triparma retinervis TaxID=2557542 RepID=A0A9W7AFB1_9STRA|nr:hypothetical protein TrRE_jg10425 [Triparma retinervis]
MSDDHDPTKKPINDAGNPQAKTPEKHYTEKFLFRHPKPSLVGIARDLSIDLPVNAVNDRKITKKLIMDKILAKSRNGQETPCSPSDDTKKEENPSASPSRSPQPTNDAGDPQAEKHYTKEELDKRRKPSLVGIARDLSIDLPVNAVNDRKLTKKLIMDKILAKSRNGQVTPCIPSDDTKKEENPSASPSRSPQPTNDAGNPQAKTPEKHYTKEELDKRRKPSLVGIARDLSIDLPVNAANGRKLTKKLIMDKILAKSRNGQGTPCIPRDDRSDNSIDTTIKPGEEKEVSDTSKPSDDELSAHIDIKIMQWNIKNLALDKKKKNSNFRIQELRIELLVDTIKHENPTVCVIEEVSSANGENAIEEIVKQLNDGEKTPPWYLKVSHDVSKTEKFAVVYKKDVLGDVTVTCEGWWASGEFRPSGKEVGSGLLRSVATFGNDEKVVDLAPLAEEGGPMAEMPAWSKWGKDREGKDREVPQRDKYCNLFTNGKLPDWLSAEKFDYKPVLFTFTNDKVTNDKRALTDAERAFRDLADEHKPHFRDQYEYTSSFLGAGKDGIALKGDRRELSYARAVPAQYPTNLYPFLGSSTEGTVKHNDDIWIPRKKEWKFDTVVEFLNDGHVVAPTSKVLHVKDKVADMMTNFWCGTGKCPGPSRWSDHRPTVASIRIKLKRDEGETRSKGGH